MHGLDILETAGEGYRRIVNNAKWTLATLNYAERFDERENTAEWLADPLVAACGDWAVITDNARAASAAASSARPVR